MPQPDRRAFERMCGAAFDGNRFDQRLEIAHAWVGKVQPHGMKAGHPQAGLGVEPRLDVARSHLEVMRDVPFPRLAVDPGDDPAMAILAPIALLFGDEIACDISRLEARRAKRRDEIGIDVDARAFG